MLTKKSSDIYFFGIYHNNNFDILNINQTYYDNKINVHKNVQKCPFILSTEKNCGNKINYFYMLFNCIMVTNKCP
jgi:hypothetical protein